MFAASCRLASYVLLTLAGIAAGQVGPKVIPGWGEFVDPAGDCQATVKDGRLRISVPGTPHNLNPLPGWNNLLAPRVLRDVDGDFRIDVKVLPSEMPKPNTSSNPEKPASYVAAGIVIWQDAAHFSRVLRAANGERNEFFIHIENFSSGTIVSSGNLKLDDKAIYLRVERRNGKLAFSRSLDGNSYLVMRPNGPELVFTGKVRAGVAVINSTTAEISQEFEVLKVSAL